MVGRHAEAEQAGGGQSALAEQRQGRSAVRRQVRRVHLLQQPGQVGPLLLQNKRLISIV